MVNFVYVIFCAPIYCSFKFLPVSQFLLMRNKDISNSTLPSSQLPPFSKCEIAGGETWLQFRTSEDMQLHNDEMIV
jgi:hypothetical protein